jgi:Leucine-rich repeat (LRR) protein
MPCVVEDWKSIAASSTSIRSLSFYRFDDRFTADHAEALAAVPSLRSLAFEGTSQHAAGCWAPFAHRDTLEVLILRDAIIKPEEMSSICGISSLRMLWIQSNAEFSTAEIEQLKRLEKLEILSLSGSELTEEAYEILASLPSLKELDLEGVHVLDDHVRVLSESSSLETLRLEKSLFTDEGLMSLDKLSTLKQVHVLSSKVTEAGIQRFQSVRPDVLTDYEIIDEEFAPAE